MSAALDPTIYTAFAYYIIGLALMVIAIYLISIHPVNRVFILGHYLTPEGAKKVMSNWTLVPLFGLFIFSCAVEHHLHWLYDHGHHSLGAMVIFVGWVEAGVSTITAYLVLLGTIRWGVKRWRRG